MTEYTRTGPGVSEQGRHCQGCGAQIRADSQFCARCGTAAGSAGPTPDPARALQVPERPPWALPTQPPPLPVIPSPGFRGEPGRGHVLPVVLGSVAGVLILAGVATGVIFAVHPFGLEKPTASISNARPQSPGPAGSPASVAGTPESPSSSAAPAAASVTGQQAAESLSSLLSQSVSDRQQVNAAFSDAGQCGPDLQQDIQTFQNAEASRQQLLGQLSSLPGLGSLPQRMIADLQSSWQASATVDSDYAMWAQDQMDNGCSTDNEADPNYAAADAPNSQATSSKTAFIQQWNSLAQSYGLATYSQGDF